MHDSDYEECMTFFAKNLLIFLWIEYNKAIESKLLLIEKKREVLAEKEQA